ncbi:peptide-methionine (S)-S-oxide reductase MsrA [Christiangramia forsetii]|uniref:Peptide methionine sulfoxide reductase MsrA n=2 Tax=Christiangramia forsetii TaxID=411153 RepID=A0M4X1_CHRFK|nr:peptide-methionine (S)-S-oxide reductase MsrA [Christiangramia forsetii]GGG22442.1 peptide methionine sulfoxide reductase MsrA [Christiangramia forsetii]CAL67666.1 peptide methionine sulfoxide reductase [Christiangramia forsetii KT0803]
MKFLLLNFVSLVLLACGNQAKDSNITKPEIANAEPVEVSTQDGMKKAYFASGCFWCVEAIYESVEGVSESISGYAGGHTKNPTYEGSNTGKTGHAEAVEVIYDPEVVSFKTLVEVYYGSQDPTQVNGQGPDRGSQYRSLIFYQNADQKKIIEEVKAEVAKNYDKAIAAEILPFQKFWVAEDYHQNYEKNNPQNPYIQNVSIPRLNRFKAKFPDILKEDAH